MQLNINNLPLCEHDNSLVHSIAMKHFSILLFFLMFSTTFTAFGQQTSETTFGIGINKTLSSEYKQRWSEEYTPPTFLNLKANKSWYRNDRKISLQKEAGLNLQYAKISVGGGGLGAGNYYSGKIFSLFGEASLLMRVRVDSMISFGIGPTGEYLLIGSNNLNNSYYTMLTNPSRSGDISISGINRDYFNQPNYGIKLSIFETEINEKTTIGINFSYLWTKSEYSNFYTSNYFRVSLFIGFKHKDKTGQKKVEHASSNPNTNTTQPFEK